MAARSQLFWTLILFQEMAVYVVVALVQGPYFSPSSLGRLSSKSLGVRASSNQLPRYLCASTSKLRVNSAWACTCEMEPRRALPSSMIAHRPNTTLDIMGDLLRQVQ